MNENEKPQNKFQFDPGDFPPEDATLESLLAADDDVLNDMVTLLYLDIDQDEDGISQKKAELVKLFQGLYQGILENNRTSAESPSLEAFNEMKNQLAHKGKLGQMLIKSLTKLEDDIIWVARKNAKQG